MDANTGVTMNKSYTAKERKHLERIKSLPCCVCDAEGQTEAHHLKQDSAYYCIPLCGDCHTGKRNGIHGEKNMWKLMKMDETDALAKTIEMLEGMK